MAGPRRLARTAWRSSAAGRALLPHLPGDVVHGGLPGGLLNSPWRGQPRSSGRPGQLPAASRAPGPGVTRPARLARGIAARLRDAARGARCDRSAPRAPCRSCRGRRPGPGPGRTSAPLPAAQLLVSQVAHCDNEVTVVPDVADVPGPHPGQRQLMTLGGGYRARVDRGGRAVPADTAGTLLAWRHSAAARCERAELAVHTNSTRRSGARRAAGRAIPGRPVSAAGRCGAGPLRPAPGDESGLLQHAQVMRKQVRRHREHSRQLQGGRVARAQRVGDEQPGRVGQRRARRPGFPRQQFARISLSQS